MLVREELVADGPDLDAIIWIDPRQARHHELLLEHPGKRGSAVLAGRGVGYLLVIEALDVFLLALTPRLGALEFLEDL
jgi:hypothetical protein